LGEGRKEHARQVEEDVYSKKIGAPKEVSRKLLFEEKRL